MKQFVSKRYTNEEFANILIQLQHVSDRGWHAMRFVFFISNTSRPSSRSTTATSSNDKNRARMRPGF